MSVTNASEEETLSVDKVHLSCNPETTRDRVRGLSRNPALPDTLVLRILEHPYASAAEVISGRKWSDEVFDIVAAHPDVRLREMLAHSALITARQWVRMIGDPHSWVLTALLEGPYGTRPEPLPAWAYRKLAEHPGMKRRLQFYYPTELPRAAVAAFADVEDEEIASWARTLPEPVREPRTAERARELAVAESARTRAHLALAPDLPADVITRLSADPDPQVRTYVSMRPELSEEQRAAIG